MAEAVTTLSRLLIVREVRDNETGATISFHQGGHGCLSIHAANYASQLRYARRSQERQHPIGVRFADAHAIAELIRADNDVPAQVWEEGPDGVRVLFQGHDGVFRLKSDHPDSARIRTLLREALEQKARVWFVADNPDLVLLDILPATA